jgi:hypothetical protein
MKTLEGGRASHAEGLAKSILKNDYATKSILYVQCNPYQNSNDILHRDRKVIPKVRMGAQKTRNSQSNSEPKEQHWRYHNTSLQTILKSHNNKNNTVLAQK